MTSGRGARRHLLLAGLVFATACGPRTEPVGVRVAGYEPVTPEGLVAAGWRTDVTRLAVPLPDIRTAGVPRESFVPVEPTATAPARDMALDDSEPVVVVRTARGVHAWPVAWLLRRELLLDDVDGVPVAVTFCSLCATTRVWDRRLGDEVLDLAVSGLLLDGNALLYDRGTESLFRQIDGLAVAGAHAGARLSAVPSWVMSLGALRRARPDAEVTSAIAAAPVPPLRILRGEEVARGTPPDWLGTSCPAPLDVRLDVSGAGAAAAAAGEAVENRGAVVIVRDAACALPFRDGEGRPGPVSGSAFAFSRECRGRRLTFEAVRGMLRDRETGTVWNRLGEAVEGPLAGCRLEPAAHVLGFRYALEAARGATP